MWTHWPTDEDEEEQQYPGLRAAVNKYMTHHHKHQCGGISGNYRWKFPQPPQRYTTLSDDGRWNNTWLAGSQDGWIPVYQCSKYPL
jgi:hypothetical protein